MGDFFRKQLFNIIAAVFLALVRDRLGQRPDSGLGVYPGGTGHRAQAERRRRLCRRGTVHVAEFTDCLRPRLHHGRGAPGGADGGGKSAGKASEGIFDAGGITTKLSGRVITALMVYLVIGLLVLGVWLVKGTASTDLIGAFSLSLLGWIIGAAGVVFQTEKPSSQPSAG